MSPRTLAAGGLIAETITSNRGGRGIFGVDLFVEGDGVYFAEVSPKPHDTGMVTLISQDLTQFASQVRAMLGSPSPNIALREPGRRPRGRYRTQQWDCIGGPDSS